MHCTPENGILRTAILNRLSTYCGPWTPVAVADLFIAMAVDLGLITPDTQHFAPIAEGHIPLVVMTIAQTLRRNEGRTPSHVELAQKILEVLRVFHVDCADAIADDVGLTLRQRQALTGAANGRTYQEIGADLGVKYTTVSTHLEKARKALGARNSLEAVAKAMRMGLIDIDADAAPVTLAAA